MNIHSVIYDAVFKDIHIMDSEVFIEKQWSCLVKCLDFYVNLNSFEVNYNCFYDMNSFPSRKFSSNIIEFKFI